jgi:hypothetical protein
MRQIKIDPEKVIKVELNMIKKIKNLTTGSMNQPDPKLHQLVSFLKLAVRTSGYVALFWSIGLGAFILILSEVIGILEELV